jgi:hypothetical protein
MGRRSALADYSHSVSRSIDRVAGEASAGGVAEASPPACRNLTQHRKSVNQNNGEASASRLAEASQEICQQAAVTRNGGVKEWLSR